MIERLLSAVACFAFSVLMLVCGCAAPRPESLRETVRDKAVYVDDDASAQLAQNNAEYKVAIAAFAGRYAAEYGDVRDTLDAELSESLSRFAHFRVSEFSRLAELEKVLAVAGEQDPIGGWLDADSLDALVIARIGSVTVGRREGMFVVNGQRQYTFDVSVGVDFRMYDKAKRTVVLTRSASQSRKGLAEANVRAQLCQLAKDCVADFMQTVGSRFSRPARVLQTRGSGMVARISIGRDHGLTTGSEVEFYEVVDNSGIVPGANRDKNVIGRGMVLELDAGSAWVEVFDSKVANVKRGHYVSIVEGRENMRRRNAMTRFLDRAESVVK